MTLEYLRHPRGFGKLYDDAEANRATFIDRTSSASGSAKLRDCELSQCSTAKGECQIYGGKFLRTVIGGKTVVAGKPVAISSILDCREVSGYPHLHSVVAIDGTEICDNPILEGNLVTPLVLSSAIIYGSPIIMGAFTVTGRIHEGIWARAPKHVKLPWTSLTECVTKNGELHVICECRCRSLSYWANHGAKLARRFDWSEDMIAVTLATIEREFLLPQTANVVYSHAHGPSIPLSANAAGTKAAT